MDVLYGDLENYNEVYITEELRNENKQLKLKLEEYETAMGKLQKDYDKLALEFHNLQKNYSSLLKTARAEVERKTQTITQLNIANDMKIIESLKSGHNRRTQNSRSRFQKGVKNENKADNVDVYKVANKDDHKPKQDDERSELCERDSISKNISLPSSGNTKLNIVDNVAARLDTCISKGEPNETLPQSDPKHDNKNIDAKTIDKRKSVSSDVIPKFSSEDESDSGNPTSHEPRINIQSAVSSKVTNVNTTGTRVTHDSPSTKTSDTSSIDGRNYYIQDEPKYNNRNRMCRDYEHNKYKGWDRVRETDKNRESSRFAVRDRYRESDKHKENERCRGYDRYSDRPRYYSKFSTRDKHNLPNRYRKHSPERAHKRSYKEYQDDYYRPEYERKKPEYDRKNTDFTQRQPYHQEDDRYEHHYEERCDKSYDERNKRQKIDMQIHFDQNKMCDYNKSTEYDMLNASCQSPDTQANPAETHTDAINIHVVKEIKNTAAIQLEDPRVASKKYILKTDDGKPVLYTALSQFIDIKPIDKSLWNVQSVAVPDALLNAPTSNITDDNLKNLISIEQHSNKSIESGEICCDAEIKNNSREIVEEKAIEENLPKNVNEVALNKKPSETHLEKNKTVYRIPKLTKSKENIESETFDNSKDFINNTPKVTKIPKKDTNSPKEDMNSSKQDAKSPKREKHNLKQGTNILQQNLPHINVPEDVMQISELKKSCDNNSSEQQSKILTDMAMVQDDLELSDETSDYIDKMGSDEKRVDIEQHVDDTILENTSAITKAHIETEITNKQDDNNTKDCDGHKKHKTKRKKTKSKEIELDQNKETSTEKKKSKKDKEFKSKEISSTFSDLFGDSSSLITPEDLGMPSSCIPLCEDVQDAMDINIKDIMKSPLSHTDTDKDRNSHLSEEKLYDTVINNMNMTVKDTAKVEKEIMSPSLPPPVLANFVTPNLHQVCNKSDIVKTIIISSGVQPQVEVFQETSEKRVADVEINIQKITNNYLTDMKDTTKKPSKAVATSTPYKEVSTSSDLNSLTEDHLSDSNYSNSESKDRIGSSSSQLVTNTQSTYDPPDVRIFVKRRRKGVKRL